VPRPPDLPDFRRPPVDEVAIGLQFQVPVPGFTDAHVGVFWQQVKERYRRAESQPRIESPPEVLDGSAPQAFQLSVFPGATGGRTFLVSDDDSYLLQIQNNRFYRNWRRREDEYPHFDELGEAFREEYGELCKFLTSEALAIPTLLQLEVTYINWIPDLAVTEFLRVGSGADLHVPGVSELPQDQNWASRYLVHRENGTPLARLHVQCVSALRVLADGPVPGNQMSLTFLAPWRIDEPFDDELKEMLAMARNAIVRGFTDLTTATAHEHWERIQ
jgi:uncharacterized protein (TIGR04255 family)